MSTFNPCLNCIWCVFLLSPILLLEKLAPKGGNSPSHCMTKRQSCDRLASVHIYLPHRCPERSGILSTTSLLRRLTPQLRGKGIVIWAGREWTGRVWGDLQVKSNGTVGRLDAGNEGKENTKNDSPTSGLIGLFTKIGNSKDVWWEIPRV